MRSVCVISAGELHQKVGIAYDVRQRVRELQTAHYQELRAVYSIGSECAEWVESFTHQLLHERRIRGEWFLVDIPTAIRALQNAHERSFGHERRRFEIGERVVCIEVSEEDRQHGPVPTVGNSYTVSEVGPTDGISLVEMPNDITYFWPHGFRRPEGLYTENIGGRRYLSVEAVA